MSKDSILKVLGDNKLKMNQFGVKRIGVFGSYARGEQTVDSDIDLLVEFEQGKKSYRNLLKLYEFAEDLFKKKVDVVTVESLSKHIGPYIKKEVIYV